jgi:predicted acyl esterase
MILLLSTIRRYLQQHVAWAVFLILSLSLATPQLEAKEQYRVTSHSSKFISFDGTGLATTLIVPQGRRDQTFPAIIMGGVWAMPAELFIKQAQRIASRGYVVLVYTSRGFGFSEGIIDIGGEKDVRDVSALIDWLQSQPQVDPSAIGATGVSLGGGTALNAAAYDSRIKAVSVMSSWCDLEKVLYDHGTSPGIWGDLLIYMARTLGRTGDYHGDLFTRLKQYAVPVEELRAWAQVRSPIYSIDVYNQRNLPIYIQQGLNDQLFPARLMVKFFEKLTSPKKIDLILGEHMTSEIPGIVGLQQEAWDRSIDWFEVYLKNREESKNIKGDQFRTVLKGRNEKVSFPAPPAPARSSFQLSAPRGSKPGKIISQNSGLPVENAAKVIMSGKILTANNGIPIISAALESLTGISPAVFSRAMRTDKVAIFQTDKLEADKAVIGIPKVSFWIEPSIQKPQLVAYLYRVNWLGAAYPIAFGPITLHDARPGEPVRVSTELTYSSYEVPKGSHLLLAIDTYDPYFLPATKQKYSVKFLFGADYPATVDIPLIDR